MPRVSHSGQCAIYDRNSLLHIGLDLYVVLCWFFLPHFLLDILSSMIEVEINVNVYLCSYYCGECVCINYAFDGATDAHVLKVVKVVKVRNTNNR